MSMVFTGQDFCVSSLRVVFVPVDLSSTARDVWPARDTWPDQASVARFVHAVREDPAVAVEVLGRLRSMSVGRGDLLLAYVAGLLAFMGLSFGISSLDSIPMWARIVLTTGGTIAALAVFWLLIKATEIATGLEERARFATAWLGAFEDGLALAPEVRRSQARALREELRRQKQSSRH